MIATNWRAAATLILLAASESWFDSIARAQIAYTPIVSPILNGAALTAQPVVSADRRYVRMTLNPYFNVVNGFTTYSAPIGAVGGGFPGAFGGGFGGFGGGFGGFGGMGGVGMAGPMVTVAGYGDTGTYLAGDYPPPTSRRQTGVGFGAIDPFGQEGVIPVGNGLMDGRAAAAPMGGGRGLAESPDFAGAGHQRSVRSSRSSAPHRQVRKSPRRSSSARRRR